MDDKTLQGKSVTQSYKATHDNKGMAQSLTLYILPEKKERLVKYCASTGRKISSFVSLLIDRHLAEERFP